MNIEIINPIAYPNWDNLLLTHPETTFFHTAAWARVLSETYKYLPRYFAVIESGRLSALIPVMEIDSLLTGKRGVSLPFTDECRPIARDCRQYGDLQQRIAEHGRQSGWKYLELRGTHDGLEKMSPFARYHFHTIELESDRSRVFSTFSSNVKRNIRRALQEKIQVQLAATWESVKRFCILNCMTRKWHGLPPQPLKFFAQIHEQIISKQKGFVALALKQNRPIAGALFFHFEKRGIYKYGASDRRYLSLRPNNLVMWEAIKWFCRNGYRSLDLGRTEPENQGLLRFKRGWGARAETADYYKYDLKQECFISKAARLKSSYGFFGLLPIPLSRLAGNFLYRHIG